MANQPSVLSKTQPRLILLPGDSALETRQVEWLRHAFEVVIASDAEAASRLVREDGLTWLLSPAGDAAALQARSASAVITALDRIGHGMGVVAGDGIAMWLTPRLEHGTEELRREFIAACRKAVEEFNSPKCSSIEAMNRPAFRAVLHAGAASFDLAAWPASVDPADGRRVASAIAVTWEITEHLRRQKKLAAIDAAGMSLARIDAAAIEKLNMAQRLQYLEQRVLRDMREVLGFENFEVRVLDTKCNRLDLVINIGIMPLKIGEFMYAETDGQGISAKVAATGESYLCSDTKRDPTYREGLENASSSVTVPLRLDQRVMGVLNIESTQVHAFDEFDLQCAQRYADFLAIALNALNLLLVERYTTNENVCKTMLTGLSEPLAKIVGQVEALRKQSAADATMRPALEQIELAVADIRTRVESYGGGPKTILDAEQELHRQQPEPALIGKRILVADDEPGIRDTITAILRQKGCDVTSCADGGATIDAVRAAAAESRPFGLVISDIKIPDRNGYEVFRATKEANPDTPVILMTGFGYDPHHSIVRASQEGLHSFLFKPFKASQLIEEVMKVFGGRA